MTRDLRTTIYLTSNSAKNVQAARQLGLQADAIGEQQSIEADAIGKQQLKRMQLAAGSSN